jgi:IS605 OrfB family transposase
MRGSMIRVVKLSLRHITGHKRQALFALRRELLAATNFYCRSIWRERGGLDAKTLNRYTDGALGYRQRSEALALALETVTGTRRAATTLGHTASCPHIREVIRLGVLTCKIEQFNGRGFDYCAKISGLRKKHPIIVPLKGHKRLNYWLERGGKIKNGCVLAADYIAIYIEIKNLPVKTDGCNIGIDIGYNKTIVTSRNERFGVGLKALCTKINRKKPGSVGKKKACAERKDYINLTIKQLPWDEMKAIAIEDLTGLKQSTQRKDKSSKRVRKVMASWTYRQVITRVTLLAEENRVRLVAVDPRNTSRTCPQCGMTAKANRKQEHFRCVRCNYIADADWVGAQNVYEKAFGNRQASMVPVSIKSEMF